MTPEFVESLSDSDDMMVYVPLGIRSVCLESGHLHRLTGREVKDVYESETGDIKPLLHAWHFQGPLKQVFEDAIAPERTK